MLHRASSKQLRRLVQPYARTRRFERCSQQTLGAFSSGLNEHKMSDNKAYRVKPFPNVAGSKQSSPYCLEPTCDHHRENAHVP